MSLITKKPPKKDKIATKEPEQPKISPKDYFEMLRGVALEDFCLEECAARLNREKIESGHALPFSWHDNVSYKVSSANLLHARHSFELIATTGSKKDFALKISCTFALTYSSKQALSEEFIKIFTARNVPVNSWPYFRELVQSMTQRMNIPPLVLPLLA
jgi:hypothetical protein